MCAKRVNKEHPDYQVYIEKCRMLQKKYQPLIEAEEAHRMSECPNWRNCYDALETAEKKRLYTAHNIELRKLQQEYDYLFIEEISND